MAYNYATFSYGLYGSYKPGPSTTGVPTDSPALTVSTGGDLNITTGGTYDLIDFRRRVVIKTGQPVRFTRCRFRGNATLAGESALVDCNNAALANKNVTFYDCEFIPATPSIWWDGVIGHDYKAYRCKVTRTVDGFGVYNTHATTANVELYGNWVYELSYFSPDPAHSDGHTHNDCIQWQGGDNFIIIGNNFEGTICPSIGAAPFDQAHRNTVTGAGPNNPKSGTTTFGYNFNYPRMISNAGFQISSGTSEARYLICRKNWFSGGGITINISGKDGSFSNLGEISNNTFGRDNLFPAAGVIGAPAPPSDPITVHLLLSNNRYNDGTAAKVYTAPGATLTPSGVTVTETPETGGTATTSPGTGNTSTGTVGSGGTGSGAGAGTPPAPTSGSGAGVDPGYDDTIATSSPSLTQSGGKVSYVAPSTPVDYSFDLPDVYVPPPVASLGKREEPTLAQFDLIYLADAVLRPALLSQENPAALLKVFLFQSGFAYAMTRQFAKDGATHEAGFAIDLAVDESSDSLSRFLKTVPSLFTEVAYTDPQFNTDSLFVHNGVIVDSPPVDEESRFHIATTFRRFGAALRRRSVRLALLNAGAGPFGQREVYNAVIDDIQASSDGIAGTEF